MLFIFPLDIAIHPTLVAFSAFIDMSLKFTFFISAVELEITPTFFCDDAFIIIFSKFIPIKDVVKSVIKLQKLLLSVIVIFFNVCPSASSLAIAIPLFISVLLAKSISLASL